MAEQPSEFQQRIAGEWHGRPSLFDANGVWCGYEAIRRSSVFENGETTYYMDGGLVQGGPLAGQFRIGAPFAFGVIDSDINRVYTGPDFYGAGQPYGGFVDAHYYGPGWQVDLRCRAVLASVEQDPSSTPGRERRVLRVTGRVVLGSVEVHERLPGERMRDARRRQRSEQKALRAQAKALPASDE